jgi:hypothetical protein
MPWIPLCICKYYILHILHYIYITYFNILRSMYFTVRREEMMVRCQEDDRLWQLAILRALANPGVLLTTLLTVQCGVGDQTHGWRKDLPDQNNLQAGS